MLDLQSHFKSNSSCYFCMHLYMWPMCMPCSLLAYMFRLHLCRDIVLLHPSYYYYGSMPYLSSLMALHPFLPRHKALCPCVLHLSQHVTPYRCVPSESLSWCWPYHGIAPMTHQVIFLHKALHFCATLLLS